ncbi:MAG: hypothetical protein JJ975_09750 [Bacteroidia bacterium]|nr:hypothetical protein [Bacteroidia bacterium]
MNRNYDIDKNLRMMEEAILTTPPTEVWQGIHTSLNQKRKKAGVWWALFIGLGVVPFLMRDIGSYQGYENAISVNNNHQTPESPVSASQSGIEFSDGQQTEITLVGEPLEAITSTFSNEGSTSVVQRTDESTPIEFEALDLVILPKKEVVLNQNVSMANATHVDIFPAFKRIEDPCPAWNGKNYQANFVEFGGLLGRHIATRSNETSLTDVYGQTEKEWYSWGAFVGYGRQFNKYLYASAAINLIQQKAKFEYATTSATRLIVDLDPITGDPIETRTQTGTLLNQGEVRYTTWDGVLTLGILLNPGKTNKWTLALEPGLAYNATLQSTGKVMISSTTVSRIENEDLFKSNLGIGLHNQVVLERSLRKSLSFLVKPYHRFYFDSWNTNSNPQEINMHNMGVKLGLRQRF